MTSKQQITTIFLVLGLPGCGKTSICNLLIAKLDNVLYLPVGAILREIHKNEPDSAAGKIIDQIFKSGSPKDINNFTTDLICQRIFDFLASSKNSHPIVLIDGFPRSFEQADVFDERLKNNNLAVDSVLYLECDKKTCYERIFIERNKNETRNDDSDKIKVAQRIETNEKETLPVKLHYSKILTKIDANREKNEVIDEVFEKVSKTVSANKIK